MSKGPSCLTVVGHCTIDHIYVKDAPYRPTLGGPPTYVSLSAKRLGLEPTVISKVGADFPDEYVVWLSKMGVDLAGLRKVKEAKTTSFILKYTDGERVLRLKNRCAPILPQDIPKGLHADIIHLGPVAGEVPHETVAALSEVSRRLSMDPQGYLRSFGKDGSVTAVRGLDLGLLRFVEVFKASEREITLTTGVEDVWKACESIIDYGPEVVIATRGANEIFVLGIGRRYVVPVYKPKKVTDPTGAGDAFIGGFLSEYLRSHDLAWCAAVGAASSSFVVEGYGPTSFGSREEVNLRAESLFGMVRTLQ